MKGLPDLTKIVQENIELNQEQISETIDLLVNAEVSETEKADFLTAMNQKGESTAEFCIFVDEFRRRAIQPNLENFSKNAIDLCGTGGDKAGSFNISTLVSFILASGGVPVIKHGNRSISSKCGSADLIEAVGIPLSLSEEQLLEGMKSLNFGFLFAPNYHPAFKHIAPVRKQLAERGILTFFNVMGPMLNPASPAFQLVGTYNPAYLQPMAQALASNGLKAGMVAHCKVKHHQISGVDELTACGENLVVATGHLSSNEPQIWSPHKWKQEYHPIEDLKGGNLQENLNIIKKILSNSAEPGLKATILINAATAFHICKKVDSLDEGVELADSLMRDGKLKDWLDAASSFFK